MCGICGIAPFDGTRPVESAALRRMAGSMVHRGPDSDGFHHEPGIGLGIRRLSIIDLVTGDQPISSEDGTVTVVCNGEIYNFTELRHELLASGHRFRTESDAEVLIHLYEDYGEEFLQRLRGMFGLALWDRRHRTLLLARDRFGIKPLHYTLHKDALYFASEQKPILAAAGIERNLDFPALRDLFSFGFVTGSKTLFRDIRRLPPGHYLVFKEGKLTIRQYWQVNFPERQSFKSLSAGEWGEALLEKLEESVRLHLRSDVPVGAWLSSGIDSSGIASLMCRMTDRPVQTFSIAFENADFDEVTRQRTLNDFPDYRISNQRVVCRSGDFNLLPKALWHVEDLSTSGIEIPRMMLSELSARKVKVVLTGEGADEIFGGYGWFHADKYLRPLAVLPLFLRRLMLLGPLIPRLRPAASRIHLASREMNRERYRTMIGPPQPELMYQIFSSETRNALKQKDVTEETFVLPEKFGKWHPFNQLQYYEIKLRLPDFVNRGLDRTSMAHSLEARVPFLDHELVGFCAQIPPQVKMKGFNEKYVLRQALSTLLPKELVQRKKRGLKAPYEQWLRQKLPDFAEEMLSETSIKKKGYFNSDGVKDVLKGHRSGRDGYGKHLLAVLVVQLWDEIFLRKRWNGCP